MFWAIRAAIFQPRASGGQWSNGAMGNARWTGVRLKNVLESRRREGRRRPGPLQRLGRAGPPGCSEIHEVLAIDHARDDGEVMLAYAMNGEQAAVTQRLPAPPYRTGLVLHLLGQDAK